MEETEGSLGDSIRRLREAAGLSQAELAEALAAAGVAGMYPQTIAKLEGGTRALKFTEGLPLAKLLGVTAEELGKGDHAAADAVRLKARLRGVGDAYHAAVEALLHFDRERGRLPMPDPAEDPAAFEAVEQWASMSFQKVAEAAEAAIRDRLEEPHMEALARSVAEEVRPDPDKFPRDTVKQRGNEHG